MRATSSRPRLLLIAAAASAAAAAVPAAASAGDGDDPVDVVLEDAGDQANAITLPAPARVGQIAESTTALDMHIALGGALSTQVDAGIEIAMTSEVTEVAADGAYVALTTLHRVDVTDIPAGADEADVPCVGVSGLRIEQRFDAAGNAVSTEPVDDLGPVEAACVEQLASTESQTAVVFPRQPVGPGASWSADLVTVNEGVEVPVTYHYTLTAVSGGEYSIDATLEAEFEMAEGGVAVAGTMTGSGTITGSVDNPLVTSPSFDIAMEMESDAGDFTMDLDMGIDVQAEAPKS
jgi:hypothetical protein